MVRYSALVLSAVVAVSLYAGDVKMTYQFVKAHEGKLPKGWKADKTSTGEGSVWKVEADETSPSKTGYVLTQTAAGPSKLFNLCVVESSKYKDVEVKVRFKSVKGTIDQGGGVVWRYRDANNYYICRYNPLEKNLRVYKVVDGRRIQLDSKGMLELPAGKWQELSIRQNGEQMECWLEGKKYFDLKDDTFKDAGLVGLWTKADAVTSFADLTVQGK